MTLSNNTKNKIKKVKESIEQKIDNSIDMHNNISSSTSSSGHVQLSNSINSDDETVAATSKAVKTVADSKVDIDGEKVLSSNDFTDALYTKLSNLPSITGIDNSLSLNSSNPVKNSVIKAALDNLEDTIRNLQLPEGEGGTIDLVGYFKTEDIDSDLSSTSTNPVQNKIIYEALANHTHQNLDITATVIPANSDLDDYDVDGLYYTTYPSVTNKPSSASGNFLLEVKSFETSGASADKRIYQILYNIASNDARTYIYFRRRYQNSWGAWKRINDYADSNVVEGVYNSNDDTSSYHVITGTSKYISSFFGNPSLYLKLPSIDNISKPIRLNLIFSNGSSSGPLPIYIKENVELTKEYPPNTYINLVYDSNKWRVINTSVDNSTHSNIGSTSGATQQAINKAIDTKIGNINSQINNHVHYTSQIADFPSFSIKKKSNANNGAFKTYQLKSNNMVIPGSVDIDIPKDFLVKSGEIKTASSSPSSQETAAGVGANQKYLSLVINSMDNDSNDDELIIPVSDLFNEYYADNSSLVLTHDNNTNRDIFSIKEKGITFNKLNPNIFGTTSTTIPKGNHTHAMYLTSNDLEADDVHFSGTQTSGHDNDDYFYWQGYGSPNNVQDAINVVWRALNEHQTLMNNHSLKIGNTSGKIVKTGANGVLTATTDKISKVYFGECSGTPDTFVCSIDDLPTPIEDKTILVLWNDVFENSRNAELNINNTGNKIIYTTNWPIPARLYEGEFPQGYYGIFMYDEYSECWILLNPAQIIFDDLEHNNIFGSLSANQGVVLKDMINGKANSTHPHILSDITTENITDTIFDYDEDFNQEGFYSIQKISYAQSLRRNGPDSALKSIIPGLLIVKKIAGSYYVQTFYAKEESRIWYRIGDAPNYGDWIEINKELSYNDLTDTPTNLSDFNNDSKFITSSDNSVTDIVDTGWITPDLTNNEAFNHYSNDWPFQYRRIGKMVHIRGAVTPAQKLYNLNYDNGKQITQLPSDCSPSHKEASICSGTEMNKHLLQVFPDGKVYVGARYGSDSINRELNPGVWLHCDMTYFVD